MFSQRNMDECKTCKVQHINPWLYRAGLLSAYVCTIPGEACVRVLAAKDNRRKWTNKNCEVHREVKVTLEDEGHFERNTPVKMNCDTRS